MSVHYLDLTHLERGVDPCPSFGSFCVQVCRPRIAGGLWSVALGINCLLSICAPDMSLQSSHTDTSLQMLLSPTMQQPQSPNMAHGHLFHQNGPYSSNLGLKVKLKHVYFLSIRRRQLQFWFHVWPKWPTYNRLFGSESSENLNLPHATSRP